MVDYQGVPVEIEDGDPSARAGYPHHLRERPCGISEVLQQSCGAAYVERAVWEGKGVHVSDLKGDGDPEFLGASSGLRNHDLARVEPNKTASRTNLSNHVEQIGPGTAANVENGVSRLQSDPFQHEALARLDRWELLCLIHEPNEEVRILGMVDLRKKVGMGMRGHVDLLWDPQ